MSDETNAVAALKNAWAGVVATSAPVDALASAVAALPEGATPADLDLAGYHRVVLAQSIAVMALRGVIEQIRRKQEAPI
jgi:hypothetical protein